MVDMHPLLENIFLTKKFLSSKGETIRVSSETPKAQCLFLKKIINDNNFKNTLEIGLAYGVSTLAILEEVAKKNGRHCAIDKFENDGWEGYGLDLIQQAGYSEYLDFIDKYCYEALPELMLAGKKFDFAYIDSTKQFDWLMLNFFYIDKLLVKGGIVVFDDVVFPGIRKLLRYVSRFPNYKIYAQFPQNSPDSAFMPLAKLLRLLPKSKRVLKSDLFVTDHELGVNAACIALQKIDDDKRKWDWHVDF